MDCEDPLVEVLSRNLVDLRLPLCNRKQSRITSDCKVFFHRVFVSRHSARFSTRNEMKPFEAGRHFHSEKSSEQKVGWSCLQWEIFKVNSQQKLSFDWVTNWLLRVPPLSKHWPKLRSVIMNVAKLWNWQLRVNLFCHLEGIFVYNRAMNVDTQICNRRHSEKYRDEVST